MRSRAMGGSADGMYQLGRVVPLCRDAKGFGSPRRSCREQSILLILGACLFSTAATAATSGANGTHDPSRMLESEGRVYVYSTGGGAKSSADGLVWKAEPSPPWDLSLSNNQGLWAPDGIFLNGQFYLYGAMWSAAKASAVTLMTSPTLDPTSPNYKWTDRGVAISGPVGVTHSVIDAAPALDASGKLWLVWGGGYPFPTNVDSIFVTRLDNQTGLPLTSDPGWNPPDAPGYPIAQGHKEGPYIHYHGGFLLSLLPDGKLLQRRGQHVHDSRGSSFGHQRTLQRRSNLLCEHRSDPRAGSHRHLRGLRL